MALNIGTRIGGYEVIAALGSGGMGDVYRAHDTKLGRDVAIKALPPGFADDPDRIARFEREAKLLASLNHPNIGGIYGLEESQGARFLILELVEGQSLAEVMADQTHRAHAGASGRSGQRALSIDDALPIARQVLEAIEAAHEKGIIHRDLKPGNIMIQGASANLTDCMVKVLDFGLARVVDSESAVDTANSPTLTFAGTQIGMILGTAAYMAPEQAKGRVADKRCDVWAFGCVLYEMLAGKRAFDGDDISDTLANVLKTDVDWSALPTETPEGVRRLLRRCLQKDRKRRLRDIGDVRLELDEPVTAAPPKDPLVAVTRSGVSRRERLAWMGVVGVLLLAMAGLVAWMLRPAAVPAETRLEITTPATSDPVSFALSPDGRRIVFAGTAGGPSQLWVRSLDAVATQPLKGTAGARFPFWSPDGRSIGFFADAQLKVTEIDGGVPRLLTPAGNGQGGAWGTDGTILFSATNGNGLFRISQSGVDRIAVTTPLAGQGRHSFPQWLPGAAPRFLYYATGTPDTRGVYLASLDGSPARRLVDADAPAVYLSSGWLLLVQQSRLRARGFDAVRGLLRDNDFPIADDVTVALSAAAVCVSTKGLVAYRTGAGTRTQLIWFDRSGTQIGTLGAPVEGLLAPELSPDGQHVAVGRTVQSKGDVWIYDTSRPEPEQVTVGSASSAYPLWSHDGTRILYRATEGGGSALYEKLWRGGGSDVRLPELLQGLRVPTDWSDDGQSILYNVLGPKEDADIWVLPPNDKSKPSPFVTGAYDERNGQFSPNQRWIAYQSRQSGRFEVYIRPFPVSPGEVTVSTSGGVQPRWSFDGKELYFIAPDGKLMVAQITVKGTIPEAASPTMLFPTRIYGLNEAIARAQYDVAKDGRFLINVALDTTTASPITIIQNWRAGK